MKRPGPPKGESWIWLTLDLMKSPAFRDLGINARRLIDFLLIEHMQHGGAENGMLLAPRNQLREFGIGGGHIDKALKEAEDSGLVKIARGEGRRPSYYTLMWLPLFDGTMPTLEMSPKEGSQAEMVVSPDEGSQAADGASSSGQTRPYVEKKGQKRSRSSSSDQGYHIAPNGAHKVTNGAHYEPSEPPSGLTTGSPDRGYLSRRSSYHGSHSIDLSAGDAPPQRVNGHARSPPAGAQRRARRPPSGPNPKDIPHADD